MHIYVYILLILQTVTEGELNFTGTPKLDVLMLNISISKLKRINFQEL